MKIILKIIKNIFIVMISLILAIVLSSGILGGVGYTLYNDYHMEYVAIDQNWDNVVDSFNNDLLTYNKRLNRIRSDESSETKPEDDIIKKENEDLKKVELLLQEASQSLRYEDKYKVYKKLIENENKINTTLNLNVTFEDNKEKITEFNNIVENWNKKKRNVGHKFVDKLLLYKEWNKLII